MTTERSLQKPLTNSCSTFRAWRPYTGRPFRCATWAPLNKGVSGLWLPAFGWLCAKGLGGRLAASLKWRCSTKAVSIGERMSSSAEFCLVKEVGATLMGLSGASQLQSGYL